MWICWEPGRWEYLREVDDGHPPVFEGAEAEGQAPDPSTSEATFGLEHPKLTTDSNDGATSHFTAIIITITHAIILLL